MYLPPINIAEAVPETKNDDGQEIGRVQCPLRRGRDYNHRLFSGSDKIEVVECFPVKMEEYFGIPRKNSTKWKRHYEGRSCTKLVRKQRLDEVQFQMTGKSRCAATAFFSKQKRSAKWRRGELQRRGTRMNGTHVICTHVGGFAFFILRDLVFNWDATTFSCGNDEVNQEKVYVKIEQRGSKEVPTQIVTDGSLGVYIKKYFFHNSAGKVAPPVYVVADDSMDAQEINVHKIMDLSNIICAGSYGFLVFCKSRACNKTFYKWYGETVVIPFVEDCREGTGEIGKVNIKHFFYINFLYIAGTGSV